MRADALVAMAMLLAGCVADAGPAPEAATSPAAADADEAPLLLAACEEMQARFAFPADDYPPETLPPGFTLRLDADGMARVVAIARACGRDGASSDTFVVLVEVTPPPELTRPGATHGLLLDLWADEPDTAARLRAWGFQTVEEREMTWEAPLLPQLPDHRMRSEDFLLTLHPLGAREPAPHASVRVFEVAEAQVTAALDADRPEGAGAGGPATASFIVGAPSQGGIDMPFHERGEGLVVEGRADVRHAPVVLGRA